MNQKTPLLDQSIKVKFFYSYSSEDEEWLDKLKKHLSIFKRTGEIDVDEVDYKDFIPGENWEEAIYKDLYSADIVLILLSASFMASDYCFSEFQIAVELMKKGYLRVVPIYLRYCHVKTTGLEKLSWLPSRKHPIVDEDYWSSEDKAFFKVTEGLDKVIEEVKIEKKNTSKRNKKIKRKPTRTTKKTQKIRSATARVKKTGEVVEEVKTKKKQGRKTPQKVQKANPKTPRAKNAKEIHLQSKKKETTTGKSNESKPMEKPEILRKQPLLVIMSLVSVFFLLAFIYWIWIIPKVNEAPQEKRLSGNDKNVVSMHRPNRHFFEVDYPSALDIILSIKRDGQNLSMNLCSTSNMIIAPSAIKSPGEKIISHDVEKGKYYVDVFLADGAEGSEYELTIKRTSIPLINGNAPDTGVLKGITIPLDPPVTFKDKIFLHNKIKTEVYSFHIEQTSIIEVDFSIEKKDLSLSVELKNNNKILISKPNCKTGIIIKEKLPKGKYCILVYSKDEFDGDDYEIKTDQLIKINQPIKLIKDPASGFIKKD